MPGMQARAQAPPGCGRSPGSARWGQRAGASVAGSGDEIEGAHRLHRLRDTQPRRLVQWVDLQTTALAFQLGFGVSSAPPGTPRTLPGLCGVPQPAQGTPQACSTMAGRVGVRRALALALQAQHATPKTCAVQSSAQVGPGRGRLLNPSEAPDIAQRRLWRPGAAPGCTASASRAACSEQSRLPLAAAAGARAGGGGGAAARRGQPSQQRRAARLPIMRLRHDGPGGVLPGLGRVGHGLKGTWAAAGCVAAAGAACLISAAWVLVGEMDCVGPAGCCAALLLPRPPRPGAAAPPALPLPALACARTPALSIGPAEQRPWRVQIQVLLVPLVPSQSVVWGPPCGPHLHCVACLCVFLSVSLSHPSPPPLLHWVHSFPHYFLTSRSPLFARLCWPLTGALRCRAPLLNPPSLPAAHCRSCPCLPCPQKALPVDAMAAASKGVEGAAPEAAPGAEGGAAPLPPPPHGTPTYVPRRLQQQQAAAQLRLAVEQAATSEAETIHRPIKGSGAAGVSLFCCAAAATTACCCSCCWRMHSFATPQPWPAPTRRPRPRLAPPPNHPHPQAAQAAVSSVPLGAIPNYGGRTSEGTNASHHRWGVDRVPTPAEIVAHLDSYVVGQVRGPLLVYRMLSQCAAELRREAGPCCRSRACSSAARPRGGAGVVGQRVCCGAGARASRGRGCPPGPRHTQALLCSQPVCVRRGGHPRPGNPAPEAAQPARRSPAGAGWARVCRTAAAAAGGGLWASEVVWRKSLCAAHRDTPPRAHRTKSARTPSHGPRADGSAAAPPAQPARWGAVGAEGGREA